MGEMNIGFGKITDFPRGTLQKMLADAYSFDSRCAENWGAQWREFDDFFFDHPAIAEQCGLVSLWEGNLVGFVSWDPRRLPDSVEIGHNCVLSGCKGRGFGVAQMKEAVRRIELFHPEKIIVTTSGLLLPARKMYERAGFREIGRRESRDFSGDLIDYEICPPRFHTSLELSGLLRSGKV